VRVWRDESQTQSEAGDRPALEWSNQILRWTNTDSESGLLFAAGQAARLLSFEAPRAPGEPVHARQRSWIPPVRRARTSVGLESLIGLHLGKCVLITGGSAGIGGQLARLLAIAGAQA
jgi:malonyl-CoA reductase/3-hydroxypropionate dehydrogenase (NADP+)